MAKQSAVEKADDPFIDLIYDAALDDALWPRMLEQLSERAGAHCSNLLQIDITDGHGFGFAARVPDDTLTSFFSEWTQRNPIGLVDNRDEYCSDWVPRVARDSMCIDRSLLERTEYFNEFLAPIDCEHMVILRLALRDNSVTSIGLGRPDRFGAFEDDEMGRLELLLPHLIRAEKLWRVLGVQQAELDQFDTLLANSPHALFFLDDQFRVLRSTASAEELLRDGGAARLEGQRLRANGPHVEDKLDRALALALWGGAPLPVEVVGRDGERSTLSVIRLGERAMAGTTGSRCLMVSVTSDRVVAPDAAALGASFGLTLAEQEVAGAVAQGVSLRVLATRRAVSINTVRNQLAAVFDKTGCRRQQDLVRLLASSASNGA